MSILDRIRTGDWLDEQRFAPLSWAVPGLIPEGFGLLTGPPKAGKSWAVLDVALAVASGGRAFGKLPVGPPRPVLLLALEDGDRRLQGRCRYLLGDDPIPGRLHYLTQATAAEVVDLIGEWLGEYGAERPLVILDTLGRVMPPSLPGESAYQRDYRVGSKLKALVDPDPGSTLLVVHHVRKQANAEGADWMDSTSGTNGLNGSADFTVNLHRPRNETSGLIRVTGRDVPEQECAVTCEAGAWTLDGATLEESARVASTARVTEGVGDRSAEIIAYVSTQDQPVTPAQVVEALDITDARRYLARLADNGRLHKVGRGLYTPVPTVPLSHSMRATNPLSQCGQPMGQGTLVTGVLGDDPSQPAPSATCQKHPVTPRPDVCETCAEAAS